DRDRSSNEEMDTFESRPKKSEFPEGLADGQADTTYIGERLDCRRARGVDPHRHVRDAAGRHYRVDIRVVDTVGDRNTKNGIALGLDVVGWNSTRRDCHGLVSLWP